MTQESRWLIVRFLRRMRVGFDEGWYAHTPAARAAWAKSILAGILSAVVLLFAMIAALHGATGGTNHFPWEETVLRAIERGPVSFGGAVWLQTLGSDFMLALLVFGSASIATAKRRPLLGATLLLSLIVMDAIVRVGWFTYARHRPDLIAQGIGAPSFHSFPSGHTAKTLAVYGVLFSRWILASRSALEKTLAGMLLLLIVVAVPFARLRMGAHWPTDIAGGYVIGAAWLIFALRALRSE